MGLYFSLSGQDDYYFADPAGCAAEPCPSQRPFFYHFLRLKSDYKRFILFRSYSYTLPGWSLSGKQNRKNGYFLCYSYIGCSIISSARTLYRRRTCRSGIQLHILVSWQNYNKDIILVIPGACLNSPIIKLRIILIRESAIQAYSIYPFTWKSKI